MQSLKVITATSILTGLLAAPLARTMIEATSETPPPLCQPQKVPWRRRRDIQELPDDAALPGLVAIREAYLAGAIPLLGNRPIELGLSSYTPGSHATLEARAGRHRVAVTAYAKDAAPEAALYEALATAGLAGDDRVVASRAISGCWSLAGWRDPRRRIWSRAGTANAPASWRRAGCSVRPYCR